MGKYAVGAEEPQLSNSDELVGHLVALMPTGDKTINTDFGESEVTVCRGFVLDADPVEDLGEVFIFWRSVRLQLRGKSQFVIGTIKQSDEPLKKGQSPPFKLYPPTPEEVAQADEVIAGFYRQAAE